MIETFSHSNPKVIKLYNLLARPEGVTMEDASNILGIKPHSAQAYISLYIGADAVYCKNKTYWLKMENSQMNNQEEIKEKKNHKFDEDHKKFKILLDKGEVPSEWKDLYNREFIFSALARSVNAGLLSFLISVRFQVKSFPDLIKNWDKTVKIANDEKTYWDLFCIYCFEKIDRNLSLSSMNKKAFINIPEVYPEIVTHFDDTISKYQATWKSDIVFGRLIDLVSDYDKKKLGSVSTPYNLVQEILQQIPNYAWCYPLQPVLDPACGNGTFLYESKRLMINNGVDEKNAIENLYGVDIDVKKAYITSALIDPEGLLDRTNIYVGNSLTGIDHNGNSLEFLNMSQNPRDKNFTGFGVIVGNPPFQEQRDDGHNSNKKLWPEFVKIAFLLADNNGFIGLITPTGWMSPSNDIWGTKESILRDYLSAFSTTLISLFNDEQKKKYFPGIGSTFGFFISQKIMQSVITTIINNNEIIHTDIKNKDFLPTNITQQTIDIFNKVVDFPGEKFCFKLNRRVYDLVKYTSSTHTIPFYKGFFKEGDVYWYADSFDDLAKSRKIVFSRQGTYKIQYDDKGSFGIDYCQYHLLSSDEKIDSAKSILESNLYNFIKKHTRWSQYHENHIINRMPKLDLTRLWTDIEIYNYFNLTQEEINYIEGQL